MAATWVFPASVTTATDGPPPVDLVSGGNTNVSYAYAFNVPAGITKIFINWALASKTNSVNVMEWSNLSGTINAQKHGGGGTAVTPQIATALTTTNANTLVISAIQANNTTATFASASATPTTGWNALTGGAQGGNRMAAEYNIATATGNFSGAWTMGVAATAGMAQLAFDYGTTPVLVNQTEQDNASGHASDTITIPRTTSGNALVIIVGQAAATTAVNYNVADGPVIDPKTFVPVPFTQGAGSTLSHL